MPFPWIVKNTFPALSKLPLSIAIAPNIARKAPQTTAGADELVFLETLIIFCKPKRPPSAAHDVTTLEDRSIITRLRSLGDISMSLLSNCRETEPSITFSPKMLRALLFSPEYDACVRARRSNSSSWNVYLNANVIHRSSIFNQDLVNWTKQLKKITKSIIIFESVEEFYWIWFWRVSRAIEKGEVGLIEKEGSAWACNSMVSK